MRLALSADEQRGVSRLARVLLQSPGADRIDEWRMGVLAEMKRLLGADKASMHLPLNGIARFVSPDFPQTSWSTYLQRWQPLEDRWTLWRRMLRLGAFSRAHLFARDLREYYRTEYYNELIIPERCYDMIGFAAALGRAAGGESLAYVYLHHDRPSGRRFGERGVALLRLLRPAFVTGVEGVRRRAGERRGLAGALDALAEGLLVADRAGRILHANSALLRMTSGDPEAAVVLEAMQGLARRMAVLYGSPDDAFRGLAEGPLAQELATVGGRYRVRGSLLDEAVLGVEAAVLVSLESLTVPRLPSPKEAQDRFRLTPAQARVALLIADGLSDREVADRLSISPRTASHHAEQVRLKLGVSSRVAVARRLLDP